MKYKIGDLVAHILPNEDILYALEHRGIWKITGILVDVYILNGRSYINEDEILGINSSINQLENLISKAKLQLKLLKEYKACGISKQSKR